MSIKLLQIGVGIRGGHWAQFVKDHPDAECVGFVDPDPAGLEKARATVGDRPCAYFSDLDQALAATKADAALVVSPTVLHAEHAMRALDAGLAVMVEKPLAATVEEAAAVVQRAAAAGKPLLVAENYRFFPAERTVRALIEGGRIGRVDTATLIDRRHMPSRTEGPWLASIEYPQLQEIAIHHFDSLRYFFEARPRSIALRAWNPPWSDYRNGANTEALIDLDGVRVQYLGTMLSHRYGFSLWVEGEAGVIWTNRRQVFWRPGRSRFFRPVRLVKVPPGDAAKYPKGGTTSLLNSLRDAVQHGTPGETRGEDNIWNVAMVEAGKLSHREGRTVRVEELMPEAALAGRS
ncbi:MAG: Gfo/Idh/MocA family protein [Geminicoccaceae bacterium]